MINALYWLYLKFRYVKPDACLTGKCWCRSARDCFFKRCGNCDGPLGKDGKTMDDDWSEDYNCCPDCGAPNIHRIHL